MKGPNCRALQHLLVQGFTLYTCPAAVCTRLGAVAVLETHPWAVVFDGPDCVNWTAQMRDNDTFKPRFMVAAQGSSLIRPRVLCHLDGVFLELALDVEEVRHAQTRLEVARNLNVEPPSLDKVQAIPEEILQQELKRRKREAKN